MTDLRRAIHPTIYVPSADGRLVRTADRAAIRWRWSPDGARYRAAGRHRHTGGEVETQTQQIEGILFQERLVARFASLFGLLALLLAAIGLYGLLAHEVTHATREIGIRVALGAPLAEVLARRGAAGVVLAAIGAAIGIAASLAVTRLLGSMLFGVKPGDPVTLIGGKLPADDCGAGCLLLPRAPRHACRPAGGASARLSADGNAPGPSTSTAR